MFGLFRKKQDLSRNVKQFLQATDPEFVSFCKHLFLEVEPATRAHILVAYKNVEPTIPIIIAYMRKNGRSYSLDDLIHTFSKEAERYSDEINSRRYTWSLWATLLYRLGKISEHGKSDIKEAAATIWCQFAEDAPLLKRLLPHNVVWSDQEKAWFDFSLLRDDLDIIAYVVHYAMPKSLWGTDAVKKLADNHNFIYIANSNYGPLARR